MANFNFNKVILAGRISNKIDYKETQTGKTVAKFSIAVNRRTSQGQEADFFNITAWGQTADFVANYFDKGQSICIEGSLRVSKWEDDEGNPRSKTDIIAENVTFVDSKSETEDVEDDEDDEEVKKPSKSRQSTSASKNTGKNAKASKTSTKSSKKPRYEEIVDDDLEF